MKQNTDKTTIDLSLKTNLKAQDYIINEKWTIGQTSNLFFPDDVKEVRVNKNGSKILTLELIEGNSSSIKEAKANAAFICLAVNNHDKLIEAVKKFCDLRKADSDNDFNEAYHSAKHLLQSIDKDI